MSYVCGRMVTCDRCGTQAFSKYNGDINREGMYIRFREFEPLPRGWTTYLQKDLCPDCASQWNKIECDFENRKINFFKSEGA